MLGKHPCPVLPLCPVLLDHVDPSDHWGRQATVLAGPLVWFCMYFLSSYVKLRSYPKWKYFSTLSIRDKGSWYFRSADSIPLIVITWKVMGDRNRQKTSRRNGSYLQLGIAQFHVSLPPVALISVVTRPHSTIRLQNCFPQRRPTPSYLRSQRAGQTAFPSTTRLISSVFRSPLASSGQVWLQGIPQCNWKSSMTRSTSRAWCAFSPGQLFPNLPSYEPTRILQKASTFIHFYFRSLFLLPQK